MSQWSSKVSLADKLKQNPVQDDQKLMMGEAFGLLETQKSVPICVFFYNISVHILWTEMYDDGKINIPESPCNGATVFSLLDKESKWEYFSHDPTFFAKDIAVRTKSEISFPTVIICHQSCVDIMKQYVIKEAETRRKNAYDFKEQQIKKGKISSHNVPKSVQITSSKAQVDRQSPVPTIQQLNAIQRVEHQKYLERKMAQENF